MRHKKISKRRSSFPPRTKAELIVFIYDEHKRHAIAVIEDLARRFQIDVEIRP